MHIFNKAFRVLKNNKGEAHGSLVGHVIVMAPENKVSDTLKTHQSRH